MIIPNGYIRITTTTGGGLQNGKPVRATKTTGDWDSKTFEIKARPEKDVPDLRPGMTVILKD